MEYVYRLLNVFTRGGEALSGNPLCVFEDGSGLDSETMQALARQFNLSETTFLLPSSRAVARVRIFTPSYEMPFAGHPTLGTAHVCRALKLGGDRLTLEMQAGLIAVAAEGDRWTLTAGAPHWREIEWDRATLAQSLGLTESDIGERPLWVSVGNEQLIVPLTSAEAVRRAAPRLEEFERLQPGGQGKAYLFALTEPGQGLSRFFFLQGASLLEDPATGSATANLGGWWQAMGRPLPCALELSQGAQVQRPSTLYLTVQADGRIEVGGRVIELGRGSLRL